MINTNLQPKFVLYTWMLTAMLFLFGMGDVYAEGSKDLYPSGVLGTRATLYSGTLSSSAMPYPTRGTHYVYAKVGETITLASSAQSGGTARFRLYNPNGSIMNLYADGSVNPGRIPNRAGELAGPRFPFQGTGGNRYPVIYHPVTQNGIYRVEIDGTRTGADSTVDNRGDLGVLANNDWTQFNNSNFIWAWDISVANSAANKWETGRVYTTVLNMDDSAYYNHTDNYAYFYTNGGFYGNFKVLTRDGYVYNVKNNGMNGISFTFMVNNRGFHEVGRPNSPSYKSILAESETQVRSRYHDPRTADNGASVTQKIFYNKPDGSMPKNSIGAVPGGQTWLRNLEENLNVSAITIEGVEGTPYQLGRKGAYIKFMNESGGDYFIEISPKTGSSFPKRRLTGSSVIGQNSIFWDGKDGNGNFLPNGIADINVELKLRGGEVHFPYIDMEMNRNGITLELLSQNLNAVRSDRVFWNDTDIPSVNTGIFGSMSSPRNSSHTVLPNGTSSNTNGHKWGVGSYRANGTFGDNNGMDTWTFIEGNVTTVDFQVDIRVADLEIRSIVPNKTSVKPNDEIIYTIKARNNGPSAVEKAPFSFIIPAGFNPKNIVFNGKGCGAEQTVLTYNAATRTYVSRLSLPNGCEIEYTITMEVNSNIATGTHKSTATIMRQNDISDPDATNPNPSIPPTDPFYECTNNGLGGACNNIKTSTVSYIISSLCTEDVQGETFEWSYSEGQPRGQSSVSRMITQPGTNADFVFDIYELDNSFNMEINDVLLARREMEFQKARKLTQNIRFADGTIWEAGGIDDIWKLIGVTNKPIIRVIISPLGMISLYGSKVSASNSAYALQPLQLFGGNTLNVISWNADSNNNIKISQNLAGATKMSGYGYGRSFTECETYTLKKQGVFNDENGDGIAQRGETITYTLTVKNAGDIDIYNLKVNDPMLGGDITMVPSGDINSNGVLDKNEVWVYTVTYVIKQTDINNKGVYNLASVTGRNELNEDLDLETSVDPNPLVPSDPNYDPNRPNHTFVALKGRSLIITNPHIYQRIKNN